VDAEIVVLQLPRLLQVQPQSLLTGPGRVAMDEIKTLALGELRAASPGRIAETWQPQTHSFGGTLELGFTNPHPGTRPLDQGARWVGSMPPWGPETSLGQWSERHGIPAFLVARGLQRNGLTARHFVAKALEAVRYPARDILMERGVRAWLLGEG